MEKLFRAFDIEWDCEDKETLATLPTEVEISITDKDVEDLNDQNEIDLYVEDYLSDTYGFCHYGFQLDEILIEQAFGQDYDRFHEVTKKRLVRNSERDNFVFLIKEILPWLGGNEDFEEGEVLIDGESVENVYIGDDYDNDDIVYICTEENVWNIYDTDVTTAELKHITEALLEHFETYEQKISESAK